MGNGKKKEFRKCGFCGVTFGGRSYLKKHIIAVHEGIKPFECDVCKKKFALKINMKSHIREVHEGIKRTRKSNHYRYPCDTCGLVYNKRDKLKLHITTVHENPNPFKCIFCKKRFGVQEDL